MDGSVNFFETNIFQFRFHYRIINHSFTTFISDLVDSVRCLKRFVELLSNEGDEEDLKYWIRNEICYPSKNIVSAYLIALVCRSVEMAKKSNKVFACHLFFRLILTTLHIWCLNVCTKLFVKCMMRLCFADRLS